MRKKSHGNKLETNLQELVIESRGKTLVSNTEISDDGKKRETQI